MLILYAFLLIAAGMTAIIYATLPPADEPAPVPDAPADAGNRADQWSRWTLAPDDRPAGPAEMVRPFIGRATVDPFALDADPAETVPIYLATGGMPQANFDRSFTDEWRRRDLKDALRVVDTQPEMRIR